MVFIIKPKNDDITIVDLVIAILKQYKKVVISYCKYFALVNFSGEITAAEIEKKLPCQAIPKDS